MGKRKQQTAPGAAKDNALHSSSSILAKRTLGDDLNRGGPQSTASNRPVRLIQIPIDGL